VVGLVASLRAADIEYRLESVAFSSDYPADPMATQRSFGAPRINERGQVLFSASWFRNSRQNRLYLGRPGAVGGVAGSGDGTPGVPGLMLGDITFPTLNVAGEVLFLASTFNANPPQTWPFWSAIYRGFAGALGHVAAAPNDESIPGATPYAPAISGVPYTGSGRLIFSSRDANSSHLLWPWQIADTGRIFYLATLDANEGGAVVPVAADGLIESDAQGSRLVWYRGGPAPGVPGNYVFEFPPLSGPYAPSVGQKTGDLAFYGIVRPAGSTDPQTFLPAFYQRIGGVLTPFHVGSTSLPGAPNLSQIVPREERVLVDDSANALLEVDALDSALGRRRHSLWKKVPQGLVKVVGFGEAGRGENGTVDGSSVQFFEAASGPNFGRAAIGGGHAAFITRFTGLSVATSTPGLFRETANGLQLLAWGGMSIPGTTHTFGFDFGALPPVLMNEHGEVAFIASYLDGGVTRQALWVVDRNRGIHRVVHAGKVVNVGGASRTIANFRLTVELNQTISAPLAQIFNDAGQIAFLANFTDGTAALLRGSPAGYVEPPLAGREFHFTGTKNENWHTKGGTPPTNWENDAREARSDPPGDIEVDSANVFVAAGKSVLLNTRSAFIGSIDAAGQVRLQHHLRVSQASNFQNLQVQGPNAALTIGATTTLSGVTDWNGGTLTLANSELRSPGTFNAAGGTATGSGTGARFRSTGRLLQSASALFTFAVPFDLPDRGRPAAVADIDIGTASTLRLHGGGRFDGDHYLSVAGGGVLQLAGGFDLSGFTEVGGSGHVELGTPTLGVDLRLADNAVLFLGDFRSPSLTRLTFQRGVLSGATASALIDDLLTWIGGTLAVGTRGSTTRKLENEGEVIIESGVIPRVLEGHFINAGLVTQRAGFELRGAVVNESTWTIVGPATLADTGRTGLFSNRGTFNLSASAGGVVDVDTAFRNENIPSASGVRNQGLVVVSGTAAAPNTLRLRGTVGNLGADGSLTGGEWRVETGGTLSFPGDIVEIGAQTSVRLVGGDVPALRLRRNSGSFTVGVRTYSLPAGLENRGALHVLDGGTLNVAGNLDSHAVITVAANGNLQVSGDLVIRAGQLANNGTITVTGGIRGDAANISGTGHYVLPQGTFVFQNGVLQPGNSAGTTTIEGALALEGLTFLEVELGGTAAAQSDRLAVTRNVELGGTLLVTLLGGFQPVAGQTFPVIQAGGLTRAFANVASGQRLTTTDGTGSFAVFYGAGSSYGASNVVLADWQPAAAGAPSITAQPRKATLAAGGPTTLTATAGGAGPLAYQWQRGGVNIPGATAATYTIPSAQLADAGSYSIVVTSPQGVVRSSIAVLAVEPPSPSSARLVNLSTRALTRTGDQVLIPGFVVGGSGTKRLLIRGIGPTLEDYGVGGVLANPILELVRGGTVIASNDDWGAGPSGGTRESLRAAAAAVGAFPLRDASRDAALLVDLPPGAYTVPTAGVGGGTGVAIIEVYDADGAGGEAALQNISTRGFVGAGENIMIPGITLSAGGARTFLLRAVGPTLEQFGVSGVLPDPILTVFRDGSPILVNDDWGAAPNADVTVATAARVGAFGLAAGSRDAAFVVSLPPGSYTVQVAGKNDATGVALVEVYLVP